MTPCSFLISPTALWPRGQRKNHLPLSPPRSLPSHSTLSILGPLTSSEWRSSLRYTGQRNLPKKNICWGDSRATHSVQSIFALLPTQDLPEMVGNFPFGVALLSFKSAILCSLWTSYQPFVCRGVNRTVYCNGSGAFFSCVRCTDKIRYWMPLMLNRASEPWLCSGSTTWTLIIIFHDIAC